MAKPAAASDSDDSDSDPDTSSMDGAEGAGSNPEKRSAAAVNAANAPVDQSTNQFAKEAPESSKTPPPRRRQRAEPVRLGEPRDVGHAGASPEFDAPRRDPR